MRRNHFLMGRLAHSNEYRPLVLLAYGYNPSFLTVALYVYPHAQQLLPALQAYH